MVRVLIIMASIGATALFGFMQPTSLNAILAHPGQWDGKHVTVSGVVSGLQERTSMDGRDYDAFDLCTNVCIHIFSGGHPDIAEGQRLTVQGTFSAAKSLDSFDFQNNVEADEDSL